jgi:hypothetical protein
MAPSLFVTNSVIVRFARRAFRVRNARKRLSKVGCMKRLTGYRSAGTKARS